MNKLVEGMKTLGFVALLNSCESGPTPSLWLALGGWGTDLGKFIFFCYESPLPDRWNHDLPNSHTVISDNISDVLIVATQEGIHVRRELSEADQYRQKSTSNVCHTQLPIISMNCKLN